MSKSHFWNLQAVRHGIGWLLVLAMLGVLIWQDADPLHTRERVSYSLLSIGVFALVIYGHFWLLTYLLDRRRYLWYAVATATAILAGGVLLSVSPRLMQRILHDQGGHELTIGLGVANVALGVLLATSARYARRGILSHLQMQQLRAQQLETELNLLKAQVNQHFLFNTLNNLYGLSLVAPDHIPEALLQLAGLMRYQLDSTRQNQVTVGTEAEYLANYVGLEKLRLRANTCVEFTVDLPHPERPLVPLLLLPLVENCFKHALGPGGQNSIRICLTQTEAGLTLRTDNSIPVHFRPVPSGMGLPTLRARLAQYYPGSRHHLALEARHNHYSATLTLLF
ncbi:sensor histidine kinase [Hymenobacter arizonensis]|uniref:Histidine kinase n=1 Tax=Hymenobacter arizonensis TaxID=1227077 RepID=A0A1I6BFC6_HYMAR|nr:sensor histidine kinase [Hymenobacter arizonensis]SFQ79662.1 Histidine kinase [Hymenobacter arizonensis]